MIISYNVLKGTPAQTTADTLLPYFADIILLQEVDEKTKRSNSEDQPNRLRAIMNMYGFYTPSYSIDFGTTGMMILSKFYLDNKKTLKLQNSRNIGAMATFKWHDMKIAVISTHLSATFKADIKHIVASAKARLREANQIISIINQAKTPCIVGGDFNCAPVSESYKLIAKDLIPISPGPTLPTKFLVVSFDHIFLDRRFKADKSYIGPAGSSDHRPVIVDILPLKGI